MMAAPFGTCLVIAAVLLVPLVIGAVFCRLLDGRWPDESAWLDAPFIGGATIVALLQNAVYADVPLRVSTWILLAAVVAAGAWLLRRDPLRIRIHARQVPWPVFLVAAAAFLWHAQGLIALGPDRYFGRAWGDQYNYTVVAEFLVQRPWSARTLPTLLPHELSTLNYLSLRLGQSVLHGFFSIVTGRDTQALFGPTILWPVFLLVLAVYALMRATEASRRSALAAGALAGLAPAMAYVHLEAFLSQALAVPYLMYVIVLAHRAGTTDRIGDYIKCALVFAATAAIYVEFLPLAAVCLLGVAVWLLLRPASGWKRTLKLIAVLLSPLLITHGEGLSVLGGLSTRGVLAHIYPWAYRAEGLQRLWLGDLGIMPAFDGPMGLRYIGAILTTLGWLGLGIHVVIMALRSWRAPDGHRLGQVGLAVCMLGFASVPLVLLLRLGYDYPYQFYKLLLTVTPMLACGLVLLIRPFCSSWRSPRMSAAVSALLFCACAAGPAVATGDMARATTEWSAATGVRVRHYTMLTLPPEFARVEQRLERTHGRDVVVCASDAPTGGRLLNAWLVYAGRFNRVWPLNPLVNDEDLRSVGTGALHGFPEALHSQSYVVTTDLGALWAHGSSKPAVEPKDRVNLTTVGRRPFALACHLGIRPAPHFGVAPQVFVSAPTQDFHIVSTAGGRALFVLRGADDRTQHVLERMTMQFNGAAATGTVAMDGTRVYPLVLRKGLNSLHLALAPGDAETLVTRPDIPLHLNDVSLLLPGDWIDFGEIRNPNGRDAMPETTHYWLGGGPTAIEVLAGRSGTARIEFTAIPGPSVSRVSSRRVRVETDEGYQTVFETVGGPMALDIPMSEGRHLLRLVPLDEADVRLERDPRELVLGIRHLKVHLLPQGVR